MLCFLSNVVLCGVIITHFLTKATLFASVLMKGPSVLDWRLLSFTSNTFVSALDYASQVIDENFPFSSKGVIHALSFGLQFLVIEKGMVCFYFFNAVE